MGTLYCREGGGHEVKVRFKPTRGERYCPTHGVPMSEHNPDKPRKGLSRGGFSRESVAATQARQLFNRIVCLERCFYSDRTQEDEPRREGHVCTYPLDAHHLVEKQWIKRYFGDLPEAEFLAILHNPLIGCPLCRAGHDAVKTLLIYWEELRVECIEFCEEVDRRYGDVPLPGGGKRPSMLARLEHECPKREEVANTAPPERSTQ